MTAQEQIAALVAKVEAENTVIDGVLTLIAGLKDQLAHAVATPTPSVDLAALMAAIDAGAAKLAAAVPANTPAAATPAVTTAST